jgi:predicted RNA-binding Zn-ribbon protein involved in translation (DUF1610 family)
MESPVSAAELRYPSGTAWIESALKTLINDPDLRCEWGAPTADGYPMRVRREKSLIETPLCFSDWELAWCNRASHLQMRLRQRLLSWVRNDKAGADSTTSKLDQQCPHCGSPRISGRPSPSPGQQQTTWVCPDCHWTSKTD